MIIFQSFLLISLLHVVDQDINQQTGCPGLIYGTVGQNVTLNCKLEEKLKNVYLKWTLKNESSGLLKQVHVFRNEGDDEDSQHVDYKKRTSVFPDQFEHGNISLELTNITKKDEGTYTWTVHNDNVLLNSGNIILRVVENGSQVNKTTDINQQTGCPGLIYGTVGQNVTLNCKLEKKLEQVYLKWTLKNESSGLLKQVHVFRNEGDDENSQHVDYKKRTSVFPDQFKHGNISLELTNITKKDEGTYTWTVHNDNAFFMSGNITLHVVENGSQGNWTEVENGSQGNWTEVTIAIVSTLCVLAFIALIALIVNKWNKICDCISRAGQWINNINAAHYNVPNQAVPLGNQNGDGGHDEGNEAPENPEQEPLNADNQQDLNG